MEMNVRLYVFIISMILSSCASTDIRTKEITDVYVADFGSDEPERCRPSDVDLNRKEARQFFVRSKQVGLKVIHDYYDYAPCYIEGTLKYKSKPCNWEIRAGATGHIVCGKQTQYFVCDSCDDLFKPKKLR